MAVSNKYLEIINKIKENTYIKGYQVKCPNMETMHSRTKIALTSQKKLRIKPMDHQHATIISKEFTVEPMGR